MNKLNKYDILSIKYKIKTAFIFLLLLIGLVVYFLNNHSIKIYSEGLLIDSNYIYISDDDLLVFLDNNIIYIEKEPYNYEIINYQQAGEFTVVEVHIDISEIYLVNSEQINITFLKQELVLSKYLLSSLRR